MLQVAMAVSTQVLSKVHADWLKLFESDFVDFEAKLHKIENLAPKLDDVFNVFSIAPSEVKVVFVGQDPYPTKGDANGLAFSVSRTDNLPKSLQNIFKELNSDLGISRSNGDLTDWQSQGVFLINRVLTTNVGASLAHTDLGWQEFTEKVIAHLGSLGTVGLLMGKQAELMSKYFKSYVVTPHPSPLSAYRGFFGSKAFSQINALLVKPIDW
jgi:uracil-DNA glycosylase